MRRFMWAALFLALAAGTMQAQTYTNVALDDASVFPGALITAQVIEIKIPTGSSPTITQVTVKNTATDSKLAGADLEYIEIRRGSATGQVLKKVTNLTNFETTGVNIVPTANNTFSSGTHRLYILVKLKANEELRGKKLVLGGTTIDSTTVLYPSTAPAATFTVVGPEVQFTELDVDTNVYRGQRFLAARILVDATNVPIDFTINRLTIKNTASGADVTPLSGRYVSRIEVRRAADGALLGEQTTASELEKFATTGVPVTATANNKVAAYSQVHLEIWVTLKEDAPLGHKIKVSASVRCEGTDFTAEQANNAPQFTVQQADLGLEGVEPVTLSNKGVVPGQTFLAQRIKLTDSDVDPYDVTLSSVLVRNIADSPLADQHFAKIEVKRRADGAVLGSATNLSGLSTTGVRISFTANNVIPDDTGAEIDLYVTLTETAPLERKIQLNSQIWYSEGGASLMTPKPDEEPLKGAVFTVVGPGGLEKVENKTTAPTDRNVYPGQAFMAQKIYLEDDDDDPYNVTITRILVKNLSTSSPVLDGHVASIEVRDSAGRLLGQTTTISGLTTGGVWVSTTANNTIADEKNLTIEIWVILKADAPAGKKLTLGARVQHTEGGQTFTKPGTFLSSDVEFTTASGTGRTVSFTYSPDKPKWNDEITFTPSVSPSTGIVYARWEFGDGKVVERKKAEGGDPLAPIKHTYNKGGEFTVIYAVRDEANRESRATKKITVTNEPPKNVDFTFSPTSPQVNQVVTFTPSNKIDDPDGDIKKATFRWDFGDETQAVTATGPQNVTHTFTRAGTFTVTLTVTDQGGATAQARKEIQVGEVTPPAPQPPTVTNITANPAYPEAGKPVTFTATASAPAGDPVTKWKWNFGDNTPVQETTENTVTHTYQNPGVYTVSVQAQNSAGWSAARSIQIVVHPAGVEFGAVVLDNPVTGDQCRIQIYAPTGATNIKITVLDQAGRVLIRDKSVTVGIFTWDLKDQGGRTVPNGLYLFYLTAEIGGKTERTEIGRILVRR